MEYNALNATSADQRPEEIEEAMRRTRAQLSAKVTALEEQVVGTARAATDTVADTVGAVRSAVDSVKSLFSGGSGTGPSTKQLVGDAMSAVSEQVDMSTPIRQNPMAALGLAVGAGFLTGFLATGRRDDSIAEPGPAFTPAAGPGPFAAAPKPAKPPGVFDEITAMLGRKLREVVETAIDTTTTSVKQRVHDEAPQMVDAMAQRLTGTPAAPAPGYAYAGRRPM